jgi:hypothetical protein
MSLIRNSKVSEVPLRAVTRVKRLWRMTMKKIWNESTDTFKPVYTDLTVGDVFNAFDSVSKGVQSTINLPPVDKKGETIPREVVDKWTPGAIDMENVPKVLDLATNLFVMQTSSAMKMGKNPPETCKAYLAILEKAFGDNYPKEVKDHFNPEENEVDLGYVLNKTYYAMELANDGDLTEEAGRELLFVLMAALNIVGEAIHTIIEEESKE